MLWAWSCKPPILKRLLLCKAVNLPVFSLFSLADAVRAVSLVVSGLSRLPAITRP